MKTLLTGTFLGAALWCTAGAAMLAFAPAAAASPTGAVSWLAHQVGSKTILLGAGTGIAATGMMLGK